MPRKCALTWLLRFRFHPNHHPTMPDAPRPTAHHAKPHAFEIKGANLPLVALLLKTTDMALLAKEWQKQYGDNPDFFDNEPLVIDLTPLAGTEAAEKVPDFSALTLFLRRQRTWPVAVKGGTPAQMASALASGLVAAPEVVLRRSAEPAIAPEASQDAVANEPMKPEHSANPVDSADSVNSEGGAELAAQAEAEQASLDLQSVEPKEAETQAAAPQLAALVVDKPLRSGQQVYARGRDLVVMAMVNPGAEVIADGHIHVYAPLRGKAIAGARGNGDARIFALSLEAELISIAGIYRTSDVPLPDAVRGRPAMVSLQPTPEGDKLVVTAIHN